MSQENHQHYQQTAVATAASTSTYTQQQQQQQQQQQTHQPSENSNNNNTTYRPRSPDLSAFILPPQQLQQQQQPVFHPSYQDPSSSWQHQRQGSGGAALTGLPAGSGSYPPVTHRGSYDASPYFSPQGSFSLGQGQSQVPGQAGYFVGGAGAGGQQQGQVQRRETVGYGTASASASAALGEYSKLTQSPTATAGGEGVGPGHSQTLQQQSFWQTSASGFTAPAHEQPVGSFPSSLLQQAQQQPQHNMPPSRRKRGQTDDNDDSGDVDYTPESSSVGGAGGKSSRKRKSDNDQAWTSGRAPGEVGPSLGIDIKTKFPVARIKRIMQADEDVGKVAQATPTAVSKALELFMIALVTKAAAEARDRSSKRVTAAHLKQAVIKDQTFDFLQEIIEKVPDPTEKKGGGSGGSGRAASEDVDDGGGGPAKRKRAARGKKKVDSDED
ncbi:hypothetical protein GJ744_004937 [Endocarpon pusillum]|uniref:NCT transcriptional regulatory complex subunit A n=1 Tax=Endocarpon pusillum TaxID=364733 RepID=A0A8H7DXE8_9EURO|nr:hypothetical protein GJ744_004937 [Endocarpon pusillum]